MTRQIAVAICLAAFLTMTIAGLLTYWTARQVILDELDQSLVARAMSALPQASAAGPSLPPGDRFVVENVLGQTLVRSRAAEATIVPRIVSRTFTGSAEGRTRTLVLEIGDPSRPTKIVYSSPASAFDRLQNRLALTIGGSVLGGALLTLVTAAYISRRVTRPLHRTAEVIGSVDDAHLDRRIDPAAVPVELVPMVNRLNQMLARLEVAFRRQTHFLADAAHELRTPVAAMRARLEIALAKPRSPEHLHSLLSRTLRDTVAFGTTVEAMLDCVRSGTERHADASEFDLAHLLKDCVEQARPLAEERGDSLRGELPAELLVHAEAAPVRTVVWNLLSNALAHTPPGGTVTVSAQAAGDDAVIEVSDTGQGIPPEQLEQIFEPFYRADPSRGHSHHLGLGLYLVKRHVRRLGGSLSVDSVVGRGTKFRVTLPRTRPTKDMRREDMATRDSSCGIVNANASSSCSH